MASKLQQRGVMARLATLRGVVQRFAFVSMFALAFALMLLGKAENVVVERARAAIADIAVPLLDALSRPIATVADVVDQAREMISLRDENARLREENERLRGWHAAATRLAAENEALRDMLDYVPPPRNRFISVRVVGASAGPFVRSALIGAGRNQGIDRGMAAMNQDGLVGRVALVGARSARLLLLTDFNSRIPVLLESSRDRAILAGDNSALPQLTFLPPTSRPRVGERVVTSGHGGLLPAGLPIGVVVGQRDGAVRIQPFADFDRLEYVQIVDFGPIPPPEASDLDAPIILTPERIVTGVVAPGEAPGGDEQDEATPLPSALPPAAPEGQP